MVRMQLSYDYSFNPEDKQHIEVIPINASTAKIVKLKHFNQKYVINAYAIMINMNMIIAKDIKPVRANSLCLSMSIFSNTFTIVFASKLTIISCNI